MHWCICIVDNFVCNCLIVVIGSGHGSRCRDEGAGRFFSHFFWRLTRQNATIFNRGKQYEEWPKREGGTELGGDHQFEKRTRSEPGRLKPTTGEISCFLLTIKWSEMVMLPREKYDPWIIHQCHPPRWPNWWWRCWSAGRLWGKRLTQHWSVFLFFCLINCHSLSLSSTWKVMEPCVLRGLSWHSPQIMSWTIFTYIDLVS